MNNKVRKKSKHRILKTIVVLFVIAIVFGGIVSIISEGKTGTGKNSKTAASGISDSASDSKKTGTDSTTKQKTAESSSLSSQTESVVTADNIRDYLGYGADTPVVDCTVGNSFDMNDNITEALRSLPAQIILWGEEYGGYKSDHPFMYSSFWVLSISHKDYTANEDTPVSVIFPEYTVTDPNEITRMQGEVDAAAREILALCSDGAGCTYNCLTIHDELIRRIAYDHDGVYEHRYDIYGALVEGRAVCRGYSYAFAYLTRMLDYDCLVVRSEDHAWNMVNSPINCNERFIDVTWDDKDKQDADGNEYIFHEYFGLTKEEVESIDSHVIIGVNGTQQATLEDHEPFNYYYLFGYICTDYSYDEVVKVFSRQDITNGNVAEIRFLTDEAWEEAKADLIDGGRLIKAFNEATGNKGKAYYWVQEEMKVIAICSA